MNYCFRVRWNAGSTRISVTGPETIYELFKSVGQLVGCAPEFLRVRFGFPSSLLTMQNPTQTIQEFGFAKEEVLNVEISDSPLVPVDASRGAVLPTEGKPVLGRYKFQRVMMPSDNSCLFNAVGFVCGLSTFSASSPSNSVAGDLRKCVADIIASSPEMYSEAFLGKTNHDYQKWIQDRNSWGGAIELSILSSYLGIGLLCFDIQSLRCDEYNVEASGVTQLSILMYDGIHYDAISFKQEDSSSSSECVFEKRLKDNMIDQCKEFVSTSFRDSRQYTDTAKFTIRCIVCKKVFVGMKEAQLHAKATGHQSFGEV